MATEKDDYTWFAASPQIEIAQPSPLAIAAKIVIDPATVRLSGTGKTFVAANCNYPISIDGLPYSVSINVTRKPTIEEQATIDLAKLKAEERAATAAKDAAAALATP